MTTLHLIRHGQTNWNAERRCQGQSESELDSTGQQQAEQLRPDIEALGITAVYTSSSLRTQQTTEILCRNLSLPVTRLDSLREIFLGPWETRLWDDIHASDPEAARQFHQQPHAFDKAGTESYAQLRERGVAALEQIIGEQPEAQVLVVSHGALLKASMTHYAGLALERINDIAGLSNCSHSVLEAGTDGHRSLTRIDGVPWADTAWAGSSSR